VGEKRSWPGEIKTNVNMRICITCTHELMNKLAMLENTSKLNFLPLSNSAAFHRKSEFSYGIFLANEYKFEL
jgi:hypothetical protein